MQGILGVRSCIRAGYYRSGLVPVWQKPLRWVGSSYRDPIAMPPAVRRVFGFALSAVEEGETPASAKPFKQTGAGIMELVEDHDRNTYRAVYSVKLPDAVYVLHCFQKSRNQESPHPSQTSS